MCRPAEQDYVAVVTAIYQKYKPEKLDDKEFVAKTLNKYKGREESLLEALKRKCGPA
jgi:hypothetical protein